MEQLHWKENILYLKNLHGSLMAFWETAFSDEKKICSTLAFAYLYLI